MAHLIQRPGDMIGTAVGIRGLEGTGKGFVIQMLMDIIGAEHTVQTMDADNVFGSFNSIIQNKFLG